MFYKRHMAFKRIDFLSNVPSQQQYLTSCCREWSGCSVSEAVTVKSVVIRDGFIPPARSIYHHYHHGPLWHHCPYDRPPHFSHHTQAPYSLNSVAPHLGSCTF